jgi:hypothetical protein
MGVFIYIDDLIQKISSSFIVRTVYNGSSHAFEGLSMPINIGYDHNNDENEGELLCPSCGLRYLHHEVIEIYERSEDEEEGLHVTVERGKTLKADTCLKGNPSNRRHGLTIEFSCEGCAHRPKLSISQHKGETYIRFV